MRYALVLLQFLYIASGQQHKQAEVRRKNLDAVAKCDTGEFYFKNLRFFRYSADYEKQIPELNGRIVNRTATGWKSMQFHAVVKGQSASGEDVERSAWFNVYSLPYGGEAPVSRFLLGEVDPSPFDVRKIEIRFYEGVEDPEDNAERAAARVRTEARVAANAKAERAKRLAEASATARARAAEEAQAAKERARVRAVCSTVFRSTADKKIKDLTVREEQQVRACQALGLYPPS